MALDSDQVAYERRGSAAIVTIDRQARRNAVDGPTAGLLGRAYERFEADPDARVMVLAGAGDVSFCAGADLKAIASLADRLSLAEGPLGFTRRISSKPTIAAISGWCLAGGLELALWCDLRIATESARLGFTERRFGVPLIDGGTQRLPRIVGLGHALDMILTGRIVEAREARAMGLLRDGHGRCGGRGSGALCRRRGPGGRGVRSLGCGQASRPLPAHRTGLRARTIADAALS